MFIAGKTDGGRIKGKISFYCRVLHVPRQAFNKYLKTKDAPWKYQALADTMLDICKEDGCNDTYGRIRMYQALQNKQPEGVHIPGGRTVYRVMQEIGLNHKPGRKPNGITKAGKKARESDGLIKRGFTPEKPLEKCVTDITEIKASDGKLYVSSIFGCYGLAVLGLAMDTNMKAALCGQTLGNACPCPGGLFFTATEGHSIPAGCIVKQFINMAFPKAWAVPVADAMAMPDAKACGYAHYTQYRLLRNPSHSFFV